MSHKLPKSPKSLKITKSAAAGGFPVAAFKDYYKQDCSVQVSSLADDLCVWVGVDNPDPRIMASDAAKYGIKTSSKNGWVSYPIPDEVLINTQMHLNIGQVKSLINILQKWVDTGELY